MPFYDPDVAAIIIMTIIIIVKLLLLSSWSQWCKTWNCCWCQFKIEIMKRKTVHEPRNQVCIKTMAYNKPWKKKTLRLTANAVYCKSKIKIKCKCSFNNNNRSKMKSTRKNESRRHRNGMGISQVCSVFAYSRFLPPETNTYIDVSVPKKKKRTYSGLGFYTRRWQANGLVRPCCA